MIIYMPNAISLFIIYILYEVLNKNNIIYVPLKKELKLSDQMA